MNDRISIVVPIYNVAEYLQRCLDSILAQTYSNIEIVAVDDGSTDGSASMLYEYESKYAKVKVISKENEGVTSARLAGVAAASGEWIGFVDGDDEIERDMYERLLANAVKYDADISHCGYQTIVNDGERVHFFYNTGDLIVQNDYTGIKDLIEGSFVEPGLCNKIYKKSLLLDLIDDNIMDRSIQINEDYLMNYFLFKKAKRSVYEDFCPYHYMSRSSSATRDGFKAKRYLDVIEVSRIILSDVESGLKNIACCKYLMSCYSGYLNLFNKRAYTDISKTLRKELLNNRGQWHLLPMKDRIKLVGLLFAPNIYRLVYSLYWKNKAAIYE